MAEAYRTTEQLRQRVEALERTGKRQAAPFSKGPPKENPKTPGQKPGHEAFFRRIPRPGEVTRRERAALPAVCPRCGGPVRRRRRARQFQYDLPPIAPVVTEFQVEVGECGTCGARVQGHHPDQTSDALGRAAVQIGPRAIATAVDLKYRVGMPWAKIRSFLEVVLGLRVERSTLVRAAHRVAWRLLPTDAAMVQSVRRSQKTNIDETGWRVSGRPSWLWDFITRRVSVYRIRRSRGADVPLEVLTPAYRGRIHSDGAKAYQSEAIEAPRQTCLRHIETDLKEMVETQRGIAGRFPRACLKALRTAHALHKRRRSISPRGFRVARTRVQNRIERLLRIWEPERRPLRNADNGRMFRRLQKHHRRHALLAFLYDRNAEPTNNLGEREIRPAVIFRKVSAGNRSALGARTFEVLTSVLRTAVRRGLNTIEVLLDALRSPEPKCVIPGLVPDTS